MSKFKRVSESEEMPNYFNRFASNSQSPYADPYAELEAGAAERRAQINRETGELRRERKVAASQDKSWETVKKAELYEQPFFGNVTSDDFKDSDAMGSAIRRVMSTKQEEDSTRANPKDFNYVTREEAESYMSRGASIFNPDMFEMESILKDAMEQSGGMSKDYMSREAKMDMVRAKQEEAREKDVYAPLLRQRERMSARSPLMLQRSAQGVNRVGDEQIVDGAFGLPNHKAIIAQEMERKERMDAVREAKASIKRTNHRTSAQLHDSWQNNVNLRAQSYQDQNADWTDSYIRNLGK